MLIDRDESHVDVPDLDLVLPHDAAGLDDGAHEIAAQASAAWEAAIWWDHELQPSGLPQFGQWQQLDDDFRSRTPTEAISAKV